MRKTKIVCTIGPACDSEETLRAMMLAGMNVARLNFSHGTHAEHQVRIDRIKKLRAELEALDCEVIEAENGKEAIMKDLKDKPDGIILDIVMPEVGGIEALQVIKEVSPDIPVVMLSSAGTPQKIMKTLKMGAIDFIQKPYTTEQITKAVENIRRKAGKK